MNSNEDTQFTRDPWDLIGELIICGIIGIFLWSITSCEPSSRTPQPGGGIECSGGRFQDCYPSEEAEVDYMLDEYNYNFYDQYDGTDQIPW